VLARNFVTLNVLAGPPEKWALKGSDFQLRLFSLLKAGVIYCARLRKAERIIEVTVRPYVYSTLLLFTPFLFTHRRVDCLSFDLHSSNCTLPSLSLSFSLLLNGTTRYFVSLKKFKRTFFAGK